MNKSTLLPILGIIDSGMGGLTLVRQLCDAHVPIDIVYVGDNANVPYGNRPSGEIVQLTRRMLDVLEERNVAAVAIACNTISATADLLAPLCSFPLVDIISPMAHMIARMGEAHVGLLATAFTVRSGVHQRLVHRENPDIRVHGVASTALASLIDAEEWDMVAIRAEIADMVTRLKAEWPVRTVILGCTHYPILMEEFQRAAPDLRFIDPAELQMQEILKRLGIELGDARNPLQKEMRKPNIEIITSGTEEAYHRMLARLGIPPATRIDRL
ncbi:MAG: glutamate racemase [Rectinema sp.]|nr:glutamate racemase [Rectinema sp.]